MIGSQCAYEAGSHDEWLVTGDPGPDFPPYRFVFSDREAMERFLGRDTAFRRTVADIQVRHRTVTVSEWSEAVDPARSS